MGKYSGRLIALLLALYGAIFVGLVSLVPQSAQSRFGALVAANGQRPARWEPTLIVNTDPALCRRFHDAVLADFRSPTAIPLRAAFPERPNAEPLSALTDQLGDAGRFVDVYRNVTMPDGSTATVVHWGGDLGGGNPRSFEIYSLAAERIRSEFRAGRREALISWSAVQARRHSTTGIMLPGVIPATFLMWPHRSLGPVPTHPPATPYEPGIAPVLIDGRFYMTAVGTGPEILHEVTRDDDYVAVLASLLPEGGLQTICAALLAPSTPSPAPLSRRSSELAEYLNLVRAVGGELSSNCRFVGSNYGVARNYQIRSLADSVHLADVQPWRIAAWQHDRRGHIAGISDNLMQDPSPLARILRLWSLDDPFNRRVYLRITRALARAIDALAAEYRDRFDASAADARTMATDAVWAMLHARIGYAAWPADSPVERTFAEHALPIEALRRILADPEAAGLQSLTLSDYWPAGLVRPRGRGSEIQFRTHWLARAALLDLPTDLLDEILESGADIDARLQATAPPIAFGLEHPAVLAWFIARGADVNGVNAFGKTPLMYAAHLDLPDAVRTLIAARADVNAATNAEASTDEEESCWYAIRFRRRTALMYAAENGSLETIRVLLEAGADRAARDSGGRDMLDYLSRNTVLNERDRAEVRRSLTAAP